MAGITLSAIVSNRATCIACAIDQPIGLHALHTFLLIKALQTATSTQLTLTGIFIVSNLTRCYTLLIVQLVWLSTFLTTVPTCAVLTVLLTFLAFRSITELSLQAATLTHATQ